MRIHSIAVLCLLLLAAPPAQADPAAPSGKLLGGRGFQAELVAVEDGVIRFLSQGRELETPVGQLVRWGHPVEVRQSVSAAGRPVVQFVLADRGVLLGDLLTIADEQVTLFSDLFGGIVVPLEQVRGLIVHPPASRRARDLLVRRIQSAGHNSDLLLLANGDELAGRIVGLDQDQFTFETDLGPIDVAVDKVAGLLLNPQLVQQPQAQQYTALVGLSDGSLLYAPKLRAAPQGVQLGLAGGVKLESRDAQAVVSLQPLGPTVTYLSDLKPISYRHVPYLTVAWPYRTDANVLGSRLSVAGRLYSKGLGMHSASRLAYRLDRPHERFFAEGAIDDGAGRRGSVVFRVFINAGDQWKQAYASPIVRGGDDPIAINVDLDGAQGLLLIVDYADRGDVLDHANWLDARLE